MSYQNTGTQYFSKVSARQWDDDDTSPHSNSLGHFLKSRALALRYGKANVWRSVWRVFAVLVLLSLSYLTYMKGQPMQRLLVSSFQIPEESDCLKNEDRSIGRLPALIQHWAGCTHRADKESLLAFTRIYTYNQRSQGGLNIPDTFREKVLGWLGNRQDYYMQVQHQTVTSVFNLVTYENTVYNPLRALRPGANDGAGIQQYLQELTRESAQSCDFCNHKHMTASDVFEGNRVETRYTVTAANVFKYDAFHGLIISRNHDPVGLTKTEFVDLMRTSVTWFQRVHQMSPRSRFPHLMWDLLPKASASQVHPHAQVSLSPDRYYGMAENLRQQAIRYSRDHGGANYFTDLLAIHSSLGLTVNHGRATAMAYLTPKKENEIIVWSKTANDDLFTLLYKVIQAMRTELDVYAFSLAMFLPEMGAPIGPNTLPAFARIIDRGAPTGKRSDISAMELFAASNVNADPFAVMKKLRPVLQQR
eukprot:comp4623_c0_seq1/m.820 comp4623_c0_seq1/g.820  ORF comp4623_c0_seq1/g.820 comp4623_c0_seq1/m.820 type:complete len:475 (-) comp4623_c0_seq1:545-1969(-)